MNSTAPTPIIVLNWNGLDDTLECVESLLTQSEQNFVIHLVDNGSAGDDFDQLNTRYAGHEQVKLMSNASNLGFTRGVNQALRSVLNQPQPPKQVVLLNNDTVVDSRWLEHLIKASREQNMDIVGCQMVNYYRPGELDNAGHIWMDSGEILPRGTGEPAAKYQTAETLIGVCAGAMLISTRLLEEIGLFDEFFQTGYEDAEFGLRAFVAGYGSYYEPKALVHHKISQSVDKVRTQEYALRIALNINYTYGKLAPPLVMACNAPFLAIKTLGVLLVALMSGRMVLFRAHLGALGATWRALPEIRAARKSTHALRKTSSGQLLRAQRFFLPRHLSYFRRYILSGKKTVFER
ncbi:MAG: glycosyltransferase family 2 protein [Lysobacterales bacterium]